MRLMGVWLDLSHASFSYSFLCVEQPGEFTAEMCTQNAYPQKHQPFSFWTRVWIKISIYNIITCCAPCYLRISNTQSCAFLCPFDRGRKTKETVGP